MLLTVRVQNSSRATCFSKTHLCLKANICDDKISVSKYHTYAVQLKIFGLDVKEKVSLKFTHSKWCSLQNLCGFTSHFEWFAEETTTCTFWIQLLLKMESKLHDIGLKCWLYRHPFSVLCLKSAEICSEFTDRHVFQLHLDVFLFAICCQLQENKVNNGIESLSLSLWAFFFILFNCLVVYSVFSKSPSDKICEAVISTGGTFALLIFRRYRCSTTISDKFSKSLKSSTNQNSNVGLLLTIIIAEFKFYSNKILKQIFASKKFHRQFRQPEPSLWAIHFFFIRY